MFAKVSPSLSRPAVRPKADSERNWSSRGPATERCHAELKRDLAPAPSGLDFSFSRVRVHADANGVSSTLVAQAARAGTTLTSRYWSSDATPVTEPVYQTPPPGVNPLPPAPAPAGGCATPFAGVSFALAHATGSSRTPGAKFTSGTDAARHPLISVNAVGPVHYTPDVTITAPSAAVAADFEAGLIQNVMSSDRRAIYSTGVSVITAPATPPPLKDGAPSSSGVNDVDFAENGGGHPNILGSFKASGDTVSLVLPDAPGGPAWLNLEDDPAWHPPYADATLKRYLQHDTFRTWVGVRHKPTGCVRTIHHIDWETNWDLAVGTPIAVFSPGWWTTNTSDVTVTNGNGSPAYIRGGHVPADGISRDLK